MKPFPLIVMAAMLLSTPAIAQNDCEPIPAEWSGWSVTAPLTADLQTGGRKEMTLAPVGSVKLAATPVKPPVTGMYAGTVAFDVARAGRARIALDQGAWIDVVKDGAIVKSTTHGHGPKCSGIRKIVDFDLTPGRYVVQIVNAPKDRIGVMALLP
jgi:hypothetical protein